MTYVTCRDYVALGIIDARFRTMTVRAKMRTAGVALLALALGMPASAGDFDASLPVMSIAPAPPPMLNIPMARARMAPELALVEYEHNARWQAQQLGESDDTTTI